MNKFHFCLFLRIGLMIMSKKIRTLGMINFTNYK